MGQVGGVRVHTERSPPTWRGGCDQLGGQYPIGGDGPRGGPAHAATSAAGMAAAASGMPDAGSGAAGVTGGDLDFDELILATPADASLRILGGGASFWERRVLSSVEYFHDLSVTHSDEAYMAKHNEVDGRAIYFIRSHEAHPECLEMGFECARKHANIHQ